RRVLQDWNATAVDVPDTTVVQLVEARVAERPDAVAVMDGDVKLTYAELNDMANRLAYRLIEGGVDVETPVAVLMRRSADLVVALLAVLKAGGVYVPLDVAHPLDRMSLVLAESAPKILLVDGSTTEHPLLEHERHRLREVVPVSVAALATWASAG